VLDVIIDSYTNQNRVGKPLTSNLFAIALFSVASTLAM